MSGEWISRASINTRHRRRLRIQEVGSGLLTESGTLISRSVSPQFIFRLRAGRCSASRPTPRKLPGPIDITKAVTSQKEVRSPLACSVDSRVGIRHGINLVPGVRREPLCGLDGRESHQDRTQSDGQDRESIVVRQDFASFSENPVPYRMTNLQPPRAH